MRTTMTRAIRRDIAAREALTAFAVHNRRARDERWTLAKTKLRLAALVDDLLRRRRE